MAQRFRVVFIADAAKQGWLHPDDIGLRYNDTCWILFDFKDPQNPKEIARDGGEPEDQLLVRDWSWVPEVMNRLAEGKL